MCATPKDYRVVARDADAVIVGDTNQVTLTHYRYCVRTKPKNFSGLVDAGGYPDVETVSDLRLAVDYSAFVTVSGEKYNGVPGDAQVELVNLTMGDFTTVADPGEATEGSGLYGVGCCSSLALSPSGVLAGVGLNDSVTDGVFAPAESYILVYRASTQTSAVLGTAPAGTLRHLEIFQCTANCSSAEAPVVGWTNNDTQEYAAVPKSS